MKPQIYHADVSIPIPFRDNSAGVVSYADGLSDVQMQLIARELHHSETVLLLISDDSDVHIRYFIPTVEVPVCGHVTVAAHYVRARVLSLGNCTARRTSLTGRCRVDIDATGNDYRISLERGEPGFRPSLEGAVRTAILDALHLSGDDMLAGLPIQITTAGHLKATIPLKPEVDFNVPSPDLPVLTAISQQIGCNGFFLFQIRKGENAIDSYISSPAIDTVEDPVTGSVNDPMSVRLVHHGPMVYGEKTSCVQGHQGRILGHDGIVDVTVTIRENQPKRVITTGSAAILSHAEWAIDP